MADPTQAPHAEAAQDRIWDWYQAEGVSTFSPGRGRLRYLARRLRPGARVLNIGVGDGTLEEEATRRGVRMSCVDPSEQAIDAIRRRLSLADEARVGYSQDLPFPAGSFHAVVASEVFEHLSDDVLEGSLEEVRRVLVPGGTLLGTVPACEDLSAQVVMCPDCGHRFHRWGHVQSFDEVRLRHLLGAHFGVQAIRRRSFSSGATWQSKAAGGARRLFELCGVHGSEGCFVFRASARR